MTKLIIAAGKWELNSDLFTLLYFVNPTNISKLKAGEVKVRFRQETMKISYLKSTIPTHLLIIFFHFRSMAFARGKIVKAGDEEPDETEKAIAQALLDLEINSGTNQQFCNLFHS